MARDCRYSVGMDVPLVRHLVATIAYRASKVLRDAPPEFVTLSVGPSTRRPLQIVAHMADLMTWSQALARGEQAWTAGGGDDWETEVQRFFDALARLDRQLENDALAAGAAYRLVQGPLADALTHVGQLAMLRGLAGAAVRPENYVRAEVIAGRVGLEQAPSKREFDGDASQRK
jgi:hypothetical protein